MFIDVNKIYRIAINFTVNIAEFLRNGHAGQSE